MPAEPVPAPAESVGDLCSAAVVELWTCRSAGEFLGTGFYIAPEFILTCAHVVGGVSSVLVRSVGDDDPDAGAIGTVESDLVAPSEAPADEDEPWGLPDLAVVRVPWQAGSGGSAVVWLDLSPDYRISRVRGLGSWGYDKVGLTRKPTLGYRDYEAAGIRRFSSADLPQVLEIKGDSVPRYRSGSPILDMTTGRVVAVMKASRAPGDGVGGYAVPLAYALPAMLKERAAEILEAHDRFHTTDRRWISACAALTAPARPDRVCGRPLLEANLLDLLADIRPVLAAEQADVLDRLVADRLLPQIPGPAPTALRTAVLMLAAQSTPGPIQLHPLLSFVNDLAERVGGRAGTKWADGAADWIERCADELEQVSRLHAYRSQATAARRLAGRRGGTSYSALRVHVQTSFGLSGGYDVSIRMHGGDGQVGPERGLPSPVDRARLWSSVKGLLPALLRGLPDRAEVLLDVVVPLDLLDEPVHAWSLPGLGTVGHLMPVAVRAVERWQDADLEPSRLALRANWARSAARPAPIGWVMCDGAPSGTNGARLALGLTNPPAECYPWPRRLLREAMVDGLPLVVWSVGGCLMDHAAGAAAQGCFGPTFRARFEAALSGAPLSDLPKRVYELRVGGRERIADDIALYWDDAGRAVVDPPIVTPSAPATPPAVV